MSRKRETFYRIVYSLCFLSLCIINWGTVTLDGRVQFVLTNCTGFAMAIIILSGYSIRDFFKPIFAVWTGLITLFFPIIIGMGLKYYPYKGQWISGVLNVCIYGYLAILVLRNNLVEKKHVKIRWIVFFCWGAMIVLMLISKNEAIWPLWFGGMFGCFYLTTYDEQKKKLLYESLICGIIAGFFVIQGAALLFRPYDYLRYQGLFINPNMNALMYIMTYSAFLCGWIMLKKSNKLLALRVLALLFAGAMYGFVFLTSSRTSLMTMVFITIFFIVSAKEIIKRKLIMAVGIVATIMIVGVISVPIVYGTVRYVPTIHLHPVFFEDEYFDSWKIHSGESRDSEKYISFDSIMDYNFGPRLKELLRMNSSSILKSLPTTLVVYAFEENSDDIEDSPYLIDYHGDFSAYNIRYQIYKWYFRKLNLLGHSNSEHGAPVSYLYTAPHAHNWWLQLTFNFGIPTGILLLIGVVLCFRTFLYLLKANQGEYACVLGCFLSLFLSFGMIEVDYSLGQLPFTLIFILFKEVIERKGGFVNECQSLEG